MTTVSDTKEYPSTSTKPAVTIKGQAGKQIKIESVSIQLISGKEGVTNSTTVSINGTPFAAWKYTAAKYSDVLTYNKYPVVADAGKDAVISWAITTNNSVYPAKFKNASYTYSFVDVETGTEVTNQYLIIKCESDAAATALLPKIKELAPNAEIGTVSKV
ncbi:MAG: hypothetical protein PHG06_00465 [Parabacteroides sp.]|nr:hypothetical protein [Parabacteroides sp.]